MDKELLRVYFIMGSNNTTRDPLTVLEEALQGGITLFQFREKGKNALKGKAKLDLAIKMKRLCHAYNIPFIVNDEVDLALEAKADGIHIGQDDEPLIHVKKRCPENWIYGVSATNELEARHAVQDGADYIGVGPVYGTNTKEDAKQPIGLKGIAEIRSIAGELPIVAIGGIKLGHVFNIRKAGADGVSVISGISHAEKVRQTAELFCNYSHFTASYSKNTK
ncbi:thiamine-phosphate pyrophosphorylase [Gracilibacillus ureilyticus]|uniref:Thiamine-phosphate synthase n=1 Tax=Gracilibacillus ureilyticus TaxID=531814 RepID=A0A1H9NLP4_9BACI|nr:thiamine phosphate synthase [Gracilibacillus ureilyticus]SER36846.1 thiamine-phosphate pyrophosphorylase [Gracilibacillus ureilyticus]